MGELTQMSCALLLMSSKAETLQLEMEPVAPSCPPPPQMKTNKQTNMFLTFNLFFQLLHRLVQFLIVAIPLKNTVYSYIKFMMIKRIIIIYEQWLKIKF